MQGREVGCVVSACVLAFGRVKWYVVIGVQMSQLLVVGMQHNTSHHITSHHITSQDKPKCKLNCCSALKQASGGGEGRGELCGGVSYQLDIPILLLSAVDKRCRHSATPHHTTPHHTTQRKLKSELYIHPTAKLCAAAVCCGCAAAARRLCCAVLWCGAHTRATTRALPTAPALRHTTPAVQGSSVRFGSVTTAHTTHHTNS
jgi:hypothetical protein